MGHDTPHTRHHHAGHQHVWTSKTEEATSFVSWLGDESPVEHILELYEASGSTEELSAWLLQSSASSEGIEAEADDGHEGHDHRRLFSRRLLEAEDHDDHDHDDHAGHDHAEEEETEATTPATTEIVQDGTAASSTVEEDHDDHDHAEHDHGEEDAASTTMLTSESLVALNVADEAETATVTRALSFITACRLDANCELEAAEAAEEEKEVESSRNYFGLKVGLAMSFIAMTVVASFIPAAFMRLPYYNGVLACTNAFSGAVFLTVGLTHLLPHVAEFEALADLDTDYPVGLAIVTLGFILILFVEHVVFGGHGHKTVEEPQAANLSRDAGLLERTKNVATRYQDPLITEVAVLLHAVLECITLGLTTNRRNLLLLFVAICSHKAFAAMSLSTRFLRKGISLGLLTVLLLPFHLLPPLAIILGAAVGSDNALASLILSALATGTFLYVGAFEVVSEEFAEHEEHKEDADPQMLKSSNITGPSGTKAESKEWYPSKTVKFEMYLFGTALLLGITAVLPKHVH